MASIPCRICRPAAHRGPRRRPSRRHQGRARHDPARRRKPPCRLARSAAHLARDPRPGADRHGRRQRRRRFRHLHPGRAELRHHASVDLAAADPGALRQPGDGAAPGCSNRRRPCPADPRTLRQILGRLQRDRPACAECADHRHRVHRHQPGARLSRPAARTGRRCLCSGRRRGRRHRGFPPVRAVCAAARLWQPAAGAHPSVGASAGRADRARLCRAAVPGGRQARRGHAADHCDRRHDGGAVAAVLSAELRHRQAHHAALYPLRAHRFVDRHRCRGSSARWR